MRADNHPTTRVGDENRKHRLKRDLRALDEVETARDSLASENVVVLETTDKRLTPEVMAVLVSMRAEVIGLKERTAPFEVVL